MSLQHRRAVCAIRCAIGRCGPRSHSKCETVRKAFVEMTKDPEFLADARKAGIDIDLVTGEEILVRQGALAFTLWTGKPAPEAVMASALRPATTP